MKIIRAKAAMAGTLTAIAREAKMYWGYPDEWIEAWRDELTVTSSTIRSGDVWVAADQSLISGFYALLSIDGRLGSLDHLWVRPASMGSGVGSALLAHALRRASEQNLLSVSVVSDPNAEGFYLKHGAIRIGAERGSVCGHERILPVLSFSISRG